MSEQSSSNDHNQKGLTTQRARGEELIEKLYRDEQLKGRIVKHLMNSGASRELAIDLYQDAVLIYWQKIQKGEENEIQSPGSYLFGIAKFAWYNQYRKNAPYAVESLDGIEEGVESQVYEYFDRQSKRDVFDRVLDLIGDRCKHMLKAMAQGFNNDEIAIMTGLTKPGVLRKERYRCLERIRKRIYEDADLLHQIKSTLFN